MSDKPENPPAFPNTGNPTWGMEPDYGMTLRDWFAGQCAPWAISEAMQRPCKGASPMPTAASLAYEFADAMLTERAKA